MEPSQKQDVEEQSIETSNSAHFSRQTEVGPTQGKRYIDPRFPDEDFGFLRPAEEDDEIGRLGGYRVLQVLGAGGMGLVFKAEDPKLKRTVAFKVMKPAVASRPTAKERFMKEAQATAAIEHDNIVQIYEVGEDNGVPYIAMQFLSGESLHETLKRKGKIDQKKLVRIGKHIASGLAAAHDKGLIHRDIKPDNIWLDANTKRARILDFGLARIENEDVQLTHTGQVLGTPRYMAPEQAEGGDVDYRCDLFSLGTVLYQMASGQLPFSAKSLTGVLLAVSQANCDPLEELCPDLHPGLIALVSRLMSKDPAERPQSAREVVEKLTEIDRDLSGSGGGGSQTTQKPNKKRKAKENDDFASLLKSVEGPQARHHSRSRTRRAKPQASGVPVKPLIAIGCLALLGVVGWLLSGVLFKVETKQGTLVVKVDSDDFVSTIKGKQIQIKNIKTGDTYEVTLEEANASEELPVGDYKFLLATDDGIQTKTDRFTIKGGGEAVVEVWWEPREAVVDAGSPSTSEPVSTGQETTAGPFAWVATEREIAELVIRLGGKVSFHAVNFSASTLHDAREQFPQGPFSVARIDLTGSEDLRDQHLKLFGQCLALERLDLSKTEITDAGLPHLRHLDALQELRIPNTSIKGLGLSVLTRFSSLTFLDVSSLPLDDRGIQSIGAVESLRHLSASDTPLDQNAVLELSKLQNLRALLVHNAFTEPVSLKPLARSPHLLILGLKGNQVISIQNLKELEHFPTLARLELEQCGVPPTAIQDLQKELPNCFVAHHIEDSQQTQNDLAKLLLNKGFELRLYFQTRNFHVTREDEIPETPAKIEALIMHAGEKPSQPDAKISKRGYVQGFRWIGAGDPISWMQATVTTNKLTVVHIDHNDITIQDLQSLGSTQVLRESSVIGNDVSGDDSEPTTQFTELTNIRLRDCPQISDEAFSFFKRCDYLQNIGLDNTSVKGSGLRHLGKLPYLARVSLDDCQLTELSGLAELGRSSARFSLHLNRCGLTDAAIPELTHLQNCRALILFGNPISKQGIQELQEALPRTAVLHETVAELAPQPATTDQAGDPTTAGEMSNTSTELDPQRAVAERVLELGGHVTVITPTPTRVASIEDIPQERFIVTEISLWGNQDVTPSDLKLFGQLRTVERLTLVGSSVTDEGLKSFRNWESVTHLYLQVTPVTDAGIEALRNADRLASVTLSTGRITDQSCRVLGQLHSLKSVALIQCNVTKTGLREIARLPHLTGLELKMTRTLKPSDLALLRDAEDLLYLGMADCSWVNDDVVSELLELDQLYLVELQVTGLSDASVARLVQQRPQLNVFHPSVPLSKAQRAAAEWALKLGLQVHTVSPLVRKIGDPDDGLYHVWRVMASEPINATNGIEALTGLNSIREMRFPNGISNADKIMPVVGSLPHLKHLVLKSSDISEHSLRHLKGCPLLESIDLTGSRQVSDKSVQQLPRLAKLESLILTGTSVSDALFEDETLSRFPALSELTLNGCENVSEVGIGKLNEQVPNLRYLIIGSSPAGDVLVPELTQLRSLRVLGIQGTQISAAGARELQAALPQCVVFHEALDDVPWRYGESSESASQTRTEPPNKPDPSEQNSVAEMAPTGKPDAEEKQVLTVGPEEGMIASLHEAFRQAEDGSVIEIATSEPIVVTQTLKWSKPGKIVVRAAKGFQPLLIADHKLTGLMLAISGSHSSTDHFDLSGVVIVDFRGAVSTIHVHIPLLVESLLVIVTDPNFLIAGEKSPKLQVRNSYFWKDGPGPILSLYVEQTQIENSMFIGRGNNFAGADTHVNFKNSTMIGQNDAWVAMPAASVHFESERNLFAAKELIVSFHQLPTKFQKKDAAEAFSRLPKYLGKDNLYFQCKRLAPQLSPKAEADLAAWQAFTNNGEKNPRFIDPKFDRPELLGLASERPLPPKSFRLKPNSPLRKNPIGCDVEQLPDFSPQLVKLLGELDGQQ